MSTLIYIYEDYLYTTIFYDYLSQGTTEIFQNCLKTNFTCVTFSDNLQNVFVAYENGSLSFSSTFGKTFNYIDFFESGEMPVKLTYSSDSSTLNMLTRTSTKSLFATIRINLNDYIKKVSYIFARYLPLIDTFYQYTVKPNDSFIYVNNSDSTQTNEIKIIIPKSILSSFIGRELIIRCNKDSNPIFNDIKITGTDETQFIDSTLYSISYSTYITDLYQSITLTNDGTDIYYK